eukprot:2055100-Pleurochrysis_carterae.AAC.1
MARPDNLASSAEQTQKLMVVVLYSRLDPSRRRGGGVAHACYYICSRRCASSVQAWHAAATPPTRRLHAACNGNSGIVVFHEFGNYARVSTESHGRARCVATARSHDRGERGQH